MLACLIVSSLCACEFEEYVYIRITHLYGTHIHACIIIITMTIAWCDASPEQYFLSLYHSVSIFLSFPFLISNKSCLFWGVTPVEIDIILTYSRSWYSRFAGIASLCHDPVTVLTLWVIFVWYACTCIHTMCLYMYTHAYVHDLVTVLTLQSVLRDICLHVYMHDINIYTHIYTYIHVYVYTYVCSWSSHHACLLLI